MYRGFSDDKSKSPQYIETMIESAVTNAVTMLQTQIRNYWKTIYPIGSVYITMNRNVNPAALFGGTWESFGVGRFLMGGNVSGGDSATGGSKTKTFNIDWAHSHEICYPDNNNHIFAHGVVDLESQISQYILGPEIPATSADIEAGKFQLLPVSSASGSYGTYTEGTQNRQVSIDVTPPYQRVYFWRRVS